MQILVLGMHRSGTSLMTRLINLMGAYVGPSALLLPANKANAKGFWERKDVMQINDALLRQQGCNWQRVQGWDSNQMPSADIQAAMQRTLADLNSHTPWVMKDPRLCLTLPAWLPMLNNPVVVIASRHPLEVAQSLNLRNAMPEAHGLALWQQHAEAIVRHTAQLPRIFCHYDTLLADPAGQTSKLCAALSEYGSGLTLLDAPTLAECITPSLKRAKAPATAQLSAPQQALYAMLQGKDTSPSE